MPKRENIWRHPILSNVIAGGILGLFGLVARRLHWWPAIGRWLYSFVSFFGAKTPVWNWLLGAAGIYIALSLIEAYLVRLKAKRKSLDPPYTTDEFFGLKWRWRYAGLKITDLHSLCINCGLQVYFQDASGYAAVPRTASQCEDCGRTVGPFEGPPELVAERVVLMIQRNLRGGSASAVRGSSA